MRVGVPALAAAVVAAAALAVPGGAGTSSAWQYEAIGESGVPASVLRSAAVIRLAVVDTGADVSLPDLAARHPLTWDVHTRRSDVRDVNGHGTFVASLAAGASGAARLLIVKAGSASGAFTDGAESAAIHYAVNHGAKIINLSVGGAGTSSVERAAVAYAIARGVLLVAPVGNGFGTTPMYPAALLGNAGLAVAASTETGAHALFSNTGAGVAITAPGEHVLGDLVGGLHGYESGTSFAAPLVAGAAALVWGVNPRLTARDVVAIIEETASGSGAWTPELGYGVVNVAAAVARAQALR
ncbi:MAG TPA: S8 family serine peptidase [Gaiellaceae bacterium]|nr:S8 family serine peptidase [Gaiellaceae bacterium]